MIIDAKPINPGDARGHWLACRFGLHAWEDQKWHEPFEGDVAVYFANLKSYRVCRCCHKTAAPRTN